MAIEIIKRGLPYPERTFEIECRACRSLLRFNGADVEEGVTIRSITCPACKAANKIPEPVPGNLWDVTGKEPVVLSS